MNRLYDSKSDLPLTAEPQHQGIRDWRVLSLFQKQHPCHECRLNHLQSSPSPPCPTDGFSLRNLGSDTITCSSSSAKHPGCSQTTKRLLVTNSLHSILYLPQLRCLNPSLPPYHTWVHETASPLRPQRPLPECAHQRPSQCVSYLPLYVG